MSLSNLLNLHLYDCTVAHLPTVSLPHPVSVKFNPNMALRSVPKTTVATSHFNRNNNNTSVKHVLYQLGHTATQFIYTYTLQ